jgi:hypothetical protein
MLPIDSKFLRTKNMAKCVCSCPLNITKICSQNEKESLT